MKKKPLDDEFYFGMNWHILPTNDLKEHTHTKYCECKPTIKIVNKSVLIIHNSYDGREKIEQEIDEYIKTISKE